MLKVINAGMMTTVQDSGRWGYQGFGTPVAGAMDIKAYKVANMLVGNKDGQAALEFTMMGGEYEFTQAAFIAITGANMNATLDGEPVNNWSAFKVAAGSKLQFAFAAAGCRAYLAIAGGFDLPVVLGSRSTHTRSTVGGLEGRALKSGDKLPVGLADISKMQPLRLSSELTIDMDAHVNLRVLLGPQDEDFTENGKQTLFSNVYKITSEADRMGYRLEGAVIEHATKADIISDALCQGAIQVPAHGMPIIMMADRQTTGGYTKIGSVVSADLRLLAQVKPGDSVSFTQVEDDQAVQALQDDLAYYQLVEKFITSSGGAMVAAIAGAILYTRNTKTYEISLRGKTYTAIVEER